MAVELQLKIGRTRNTMTVLPSPTAYDIEYEDESASDAGRVEAGKMYKKRKGTIRKASLTWTNLTDAECQTVFRATQPEYVYAQIKDPWARDHTVNEFYIGNRKATYSPLNDGTWSSVSLSLTERDFYK